MSSTVLLPLLAVSFLLCPGELSAATQPLFHLSSPANGSPAEPVNGVVLWWTEAPDVPGYIVQISTDRAFKTMVLEQAVKAGVDSFAIPDDTLEKGKQYFWRVLAECGTGAAGCPAGQTVPASGSPFSFKTAFNIFERLEDTNLTLQRAIAGDDATEGAQFSFLTSADKQTVYTADFALIWDPDLWAGDRTAVSFQAAWQGKLTSDESESEDAWKYHATAVVLRHFGQRLDGLRWATGLKYETSQDASVKKALWENVLTPTVPRLGIGVALPSPDPKHAVQFIWRPFLGFDVGHTVRPGESAEIESTILRITPRVRATVRFNAVARALNIPAANLFFDNIFVMLPNEEVSEHNFFVSGFELKITHNIGLGVTYKNGEAAPRFRHIETLGGVLTISFGK